MRIPGPDFALTLDMRKRLPLILLLLLGEPLAGNFRIWAEPKLGGVGWIKGVRKDDFVRDGGWFVDPDYTLKEYEGYSLPLMASFNLNFAAIGIGLNRVPHVQKDHPETGCFLSIPFGLSTDGDS